MSEFSMIGCTDNIVWVFGKYAFWELGQFVHFVMSTGMEGLRSNAGMERRHLARRETLNAYRLRISREVLSDKLDVSATSSSALRALTTSVDMTPILATDDHPDKYISQRNQNL